MMTRMLLALIIVWPVAASAEPTDTRGLRDLPVGNYKGSYTCAQGETPMDLMIHQRPDGTYDGSFSFYVGQVPGRFDVTLVERADGVILMIPQSTTTSRRRFSSISAELRRDAWTLQGRVTTPGCGAISMTFDNAMGRSLPEGTLEAIGGAFANNKIAENWIATHCTTTMKPGSNPEDEETVTTCDPNAKPPVGFRLKK